MSEPDRIRTRPAPICPACGGSGPIAHDDLRDSLFGAPGTWSMRRCATPGRGTHWLDPAPSVEDLPIAYRRYYTHSAGVAETFVRRVYWRAARGWLARRWGYASATPTDRVLGLVFAVLPMRREELEHSIVFLRGRPGGRVLDVGIGEELVLEANR